MNKKINKIITNLENCFGIFDYSLTPTESNLLVLYLKELQQENKKLKENAENNGKLVDKVKWENMLLKKENQELKSKLELYKNGVYFSSEVDEKDKQIDKLKKKYENAVADYEKIEFEKEQLNSLVNSCQEEIRQLKKQLEEWEHHLKCSKEMLDIQGQKGNYDYDEYMLGLYNGMEYIIVLFETREPNFISGKDVEFTNNKTQQKEFIKYLEDEKDRLARVCSNICEDKFDEVDDILQKYKSIIGVSDENNKQ